MKALFLTNEYPPHIYGGAGVHVEYLCRELAKLIPVEVRCFGDQDSPTSNPAARGFGLDASDWTAPKKLQSAFGALQRCLDFNTTAVDAQVVHCHTWYSHFGGILVGFIAPLVTLLAKGNESPTVRAHSVEALNFQITWGIATIVASVFIMR
jgi:glycosyltransferase involved in cell wall biosynthesis